MSQSSNLSGLMRLVARILCRGGWGVAAWAVLQGCLFNTRHEPPAILFLGNSITLHDPLPAVGWRQRNGMAASSPDSDYAHQTIRKLDGRGIRARVEYGSRDCDVCDGPIDEHARNIAADLERVRPRWVVVQLGENMNDLEVGVGKLTLQYRQLLNALRQGGSFPIFCLTVWNDTALDAGHTAAVRTALSEFSGAHLVDITSVAKDPANFGDSLLYPNAAVRWHPGDKGMSAIAGILADSLAGYP